MLCIFNNFTVISRLNALLSFHFLFFRGETLHFCTKTHGQPPSFPVSGVVPSAARAAVNVSASSAHRLCLSSTANERVQSELKGLPCVRKDAQCVKASPGHPCAFSPVSLFSLFSTRVHSLFNTTSGGLSGSLAIDE